MLGRLAFVAVSFSMLTTPGLAANAATAEAH